jgi:NAD dependent epimerase/dehydratase
VNPLFWKNRKVLVTGAGGFIGSHLCETLLESGADVRALLHYDTRADYGNLEFLPPELRSRLEVVSGDICDPFLINRVVEGVDTVFHLGALIAIPYSYVAPLSYVRTNIEGTVNVLEACRHHKTRRMVHTSTSEVYGTAVYAPIDEKHPLQGQSPYSASKIAADKMAESYYRSFELPVTTLRPFNTYGPRQSARAFIPTVISQCLSEQKTIQLGDLTPIRDLNFVRDTAHAFMAVGEQDACIGETFNTGIGVGHSVGDVVKLITKLTGVEKPIVTDPRRIRPAQSEVFKLISTSQKLQSTTSWRPSTQLEQGLSQTIKFVKEHMNRFKAENYAI